MWVQWEEGTWRGSCSSGSQVKRQLVPTLQPWKGDEYSIPKEDGGLFVASGILILSTAQKPVV